MAANTINSENFRAVKWGLQMQLTVKSEFQTNFMNGVFSSKLRHVIIFM